MSKKSKKNYNPEKLREKNALKKTARDAKKKKQSIVQRIVGILIVVGIFAAIILYFREPPKTIDDIFTKTVSLSDTIDLNALPASE